MRRLFTHDGSTGQPDVGLAQLHAVGETPYDPTIADPDPAILELDELDDDLTFDRLLQLAVAELAHDERLAEAEAEDEAEVPLTLAPTPTAVIQQQTATPTTPTTVIQQQTATPTPTPAVTEEQRLARIRQQEKIKRERLAARAKRLKLARVALRKKLIAAAERKRQVAAAVKRARKITIQEKKKAAEVKKKAISQRNELKRILKKHWQQPYAYKLKAIYALYREKKASAGQCISRMKARIKIEKQEIVRANIRALLKANKGESYYKKLQGIVELYKKDRDSPSVYLNRLVDRVTIERKLRGSMFSPYHSSSSDNGRSPDYSWGGGPAGNSGNGDGGCKDSPGGSCPQ